MRQRDFYKAGFTLIEIMVVIVILGLLALFVVPRVIDRPDQARVVKAEQDIRAIESALKLYRLDHFQYPNMSVGLVALRGDYLDRLPKDPWGNDYLYRYPGQHSEVDIYTFGADGKIGGTGVNADIGNWDLQ